MDTTGSSQGHPLESVWIGTPPRQTNLFCHFNVENSINDVLSQRFSERNANDAEPLVGLDRFFCSRDRCREVLSKDLAFTRRPLHPTTHPESQFVCRGVILVGLSQHIGGAIVRTWNLHNWRIRIADVVSPSIIGLPVTTGIPPPV